MKRIILTVAVGGTLLSAAALLRAQDPTKVDPKHYKAEFENDAVRILRIKYGPGEKSVMHYHPESVVVFLTDQKATFTTPDGKSTEVDAKAGEVKNLPGGPHLPQNISDKPMELILIEFKAKSAAK
jgi:quercetin dioxygenase-like cupin family protein